jgi:hypothetical protein
MSLLTVAGRYYGIPLELIAIPLELIAMRTFYGIRSLLQGDAK